MKAIKAHPEQMNEDNGIGEMQGKPMIAMEPEGPQPPATEEELFWVN